MATYVILSRVAPGSFRDPGHFKTLTEQVIKKVAEACPGIKFKDSYATMGRFDFVDIVEADDPIEVTRAAMIIRALGPSETEIMAATPFREFLAGL